MKKILLMLFLIAIQHSFVFAQTNKKLSQKNVHQEDSKTRSSSRIQLGRLKYSQNMVNISKDNETILSLPDTIIEYSITDTTRSIHTYDEKGNLRSWTSQAYVKNKWENIERVSFTFDVNGNYLTELYEEWVNDYWLYIEKGSYTYDENGNSITSVYEDWINDSWVITSQYRTTNVYDASENLISEIGEKFEDNEWINNRRNDYSHDSSGNLLEKYLYKYQSDPWEYREKTIYTYDLNGNKKTELKQYYSNGTWSNGESKTYFYNPDGSVSEIIFYHPNVEPPANEYDTIRYEYDSNGNLLSRGESEIYTYDSEGNLLTWDFYTWDSESNQWIKKWSEPCVIFIKTDYTGKIWNEHPQKFGNGIIFYTVGQGNKMIFHWTQVAITGINNIYEDDKITVFPNPTSTVLNIRGIKKPSIVNVYSMDGKQMLTNIVSGNNQILNIKQLKSGIYILKIETHAGIVMKKFIKQ